MGKRLESTPVDKKMLHDFTVEELEAELEGLKEKAKQQCLALRQTEYDMETVRAILVFKKSLEPLKD